MKDDKMLFCEIEDIRKYDINVCKKCDLLGSIHFCPLSKNKGILEDIYKVKKTDLFKSRGDYTLSLELKVFNFFLMLSDIRHILLLLVFALLFIQLLNEDLDKRGMRTRTRTRNDSYVSDEDNKRFGMMYDYE